MVMLLFPPYLPQTTPLKVCVTGAAGQIAYSLLYQIVHGDVFGKEQVSGQGLPTVQLYTAGACYIYTSFIWGQTLCLTQHVCIPESCFCVTKALLFLIPCSSLPSSVPSHC